MTAPQQPRRAGRVIDAGLRLMDRQIVDKDGFLAGKVDDLELEPPVIGGGPPVVTAILSGPGALGVRIGGHLGRWLESVHARLHPDRDPTPARLGFGAVAELSERVHLTVSRHDLETDRLEAWVREMVVGEIPGAGDAPE